MGGLDPGVALGSTRVYRSLSRDPRNSCFTSPVSNSRIRVHGVRYTWWGTGFPNSRWIDSVLHSVFTFFHIWFSQNQIFNNLPLDFDSHPPSHNQISPRVDEDGVSGYCNPGISFSPKARLVIDEVRNQGLGPKLVGIQTIPFLLSRLPSYYSGSESDAPGLSNSARCSGIGPCSSMRI